MKNKTKETHVFSDGDWIGVAIDNPTAEQWGKAATSFDGGNYITDAFIVIDFGFGGQFIPIPRNKKDLYEIVAPGEEYSDEAAKDMTDTPIGIMVMGEIAFGGGLNPDPDGAAAALQAAGFEVVRMDERYRNLVDVPGDDHMEATKVGTDVKAVMEEIERIVEPFGGHCHEGGELSDDHVPLKQIHDEMAAKQQA
jgi:hypothetical protein